MTQGGDLVESDHSAARPRADSRKEVMVLPSVCFLLYPCWIDSSGTGWDEDRRQEPARTGGRAPDMSDRTPNEHRHEHAFANLNPLEREGLVVAGRRNMMKAGLAGLAGLSLPGLLRARAGAAEAGRSIGGNNCHPAMDD